MCRMDYQMQFIYFPIWEVQQELLSIDLCICCEFLPYTYNSLSEEELKVLCRIVNK